MDRVIQRLWTLDSWSMERITPPLNGLKKGTKSSITSLHEAKNLTSQWVRLWQTHDHLVKPTTMSACFHIAKYTIVNCDHSRYTILRHSKAPSALTLTYDIIYGLIIAYNSYLKRTKVIKVLLLDFYRLGIL